MPAVLRWMLILSLLCWSATGSLRAVLAQDDFIDPQLLTSPAEGEEFELQGEELESPLLDPLAFPSTTLSFGWLPAGSSPDFGIASFNAQHAWQWNLAGHPEPIIIAPGAGLHLWSGPHALDLPPRVYDLYLDLSWRFISREQWGLTGGLTPGFYGDFQRLDGDAFQLTGWLIGDWSLGERWTLLGGIAYVRQLESNLLPVGGLVYRPNDDWRLEFVIPRPRIARRFGQHEAGETWGYLSGNFGGGAWAVDDGNQNVLVQYSDLRLALGVEWQRDNGSATGLELGYAFSRDIALDGYSVFSPEGALSLQLTTSF